MLNQELRHGNFSNSEIYKLTVKGSREMTEQELAAHKAANPKSRVKTIADGFGKAAETYIKQKIQERRMGAPLGLETFARPFAWGHLCEYRVLGQLLGLEYSYNSDTTIKHPTIPYWVGTPDGERNSAGTEAVCDVKAPSSRESFCDLVDPLYNGLDGLDAMAAIRENHKDGEKYYWQLVGNAILTGRDAAELIVYLPYRSELEAIRNLSNDGQHQNKWITWALDEELPHLPDGSGYKNLNIIRFPVTAEAKQTLTDCVLSAGKILDEAVKALTNH